MAAIRLRIVVAGETSFVFGLAGWTYCVSFEPNFVSIALEQDHPTSTVWRSIILSRK